MNPPDAEGRLREALQNALAYIPYGCEAYFRALRALNGGEAHEPREARG